MYPGVTNLTPGIKDGIETIEGALQWGNPAYHPQWMTRGLVSGASRDLGNTGNTSELRMGLALGYHVANDHWLPYDSTLADNVGGVLKGILFTPSQMVVNGANEDQTLGILWGGPIVATEVLLNEGTAGSLVGHATEAAVRTFMDANGWKLDDFFQQ